MKKDFLFLLIVMAATMSATAQSRGIKIGYIDMEYILQNVPDYAEANNQLELKAQGWKQEIETKRKEIDKLKDQLKTERVLLTRELIEEREEEITFQESELSDYQQKRFGPTGDLNIQKSVLVKPIQDQVFTITQDIAEQLKYDFIFDKSSDLTMLFAKKNHDISDRVVRQLTRAEKREQLSKKQLKEEEAREAKEDMIDDNPALAERQRLLEEKKAARQKLIEDRKAAAEARKAEAAEKRRLLLEEREARKNGGTPPSTSDEENKTAAEDEPKVDGNVAEEDKPKTPATDDARQNAADERARKLAERKQQIEERRQKALQDRENAKKEKEDNKTD
ncbi:MAG: OmpH family outer membrane protein [Flavobacterium sp.]|nr:OmpH family outer membrane protein [Flavobacterium sp.]